MRNTILLMLIFAFVSLQAQFSPCYHYTIAKANHLLQYENDCEKAKQFLDKAFENVTDTIAKDMLLAAKVYECLGELDSMIHSIRIAILKGGYEWEEIENWRKYNLFQPHDVLFQQLEAKYLSLKQHYQATMDLDWYVTLLSMEKLDQHFRKGEVRKGLDNCPPKGKIKYPLMGITDSLIMREFIEKVEKQGFPPLKNMDFKANTAMFLMMLHGGTEFDWVVSFFEKIAPEQIKMGNLQPYFFSKSYDRYLQQKLFEKQCFGSYNPACEGKIICPIEKLEEVDKRRVTIGLLPLNESHEAMTGYTLPEDYQPPTKEQIEKCTLRDKTVKL